MLNYLIYNKLITIVYRKCFKTFMNTLFMTILLLFFIFPFQRSLSQLPNIVEAEYFWDTDPGFGSGNALIINTSGQNITLSDNFNVSSLSPGIHRLYIRIKDDNGIWSHTLLKPVWVTDSSYTQNPLADLVYAEYFWNTDPGFGNGTALNVIAGKAIDLSEKIG